MSSERAYPLVQLVTAPSVGATVLYDFNLSSDVGVGHDGFSLGAPEWSGQPGMVGGRAGYRTVSFSHYVEASAPEYVAELTALSRLLTASDGWLLVQLSMFSRPRWLRTWRSDAAELSWEQIRLDAPDQPRGWFEIPISLTCDPWLRGERITHDLGTISMDPATGCFKLLPAIVGDAPAPASLSMVWQIAGRAATRTIAATAPMLGDRTTPLVYQCESLSTLGTDATVIADTAWSGGQAVSVSFATETGMDTRLSGSLDAVPPGRYKVMVRAGRSDSDSTFAFRFGSSIEFDTSWGERVVREWWSAPQHQAWVDLGDFWLPIGVPPVDLSGEAVVAPEVAVQAERLSGTGALVMDALMLIPATDETRMLLRDDGNLGITHLSIAEVFDSEQESSYARSVASGALSTRIPPQLAGGFPQVVPGVTQGLYVFAQAHPLWSNWLGTNNPDRIDESVAVTLDYAPRYMWPDPMGA